jgi:hypothetical protein
MLPKPFFRQNLKKVLEKSDPKIWPASVIFDKVTRKKQSFNGRIFAESGHPDSRIRNAGFILKMGAAFSAIHYH